MQWVGSDSPVVSALVATGVISLIPNLILVFMPETSQSTQTPQNVSEPSKKNSRSNILGSLSFMSMFLCFTVGALLGDVFLHSLPHLLGLHDHDHDHSGHEHAHHVEEERFHELKHEHGHSEHDDHHDHNHAKVFSAPCMQGLDGQTCNASMETDDHSKLFGYDRVIASLCLILLGFLLFYCADRLATLYLGREHAHTHDHGSPNANTKTAYKESSPDNILESRGESQCMKPSGWLNLFADALHNFTDGLAIGTAYASAQSPLVFARFLSVLLHELPHELGDYAILVRSGVSKWQAIKLQFVTAIAAFVGTGVGLLALKGGLLEVLLPPITTGGFLYVAATSVLPDVLKGDGSDARSTGMEILQLVGEVGFFMAGVGLMLAVTYLE